MTVIVWDGHTLAADKLCQDTYTRRSTTKIQRRQTAPELVGGAQWD